MGINKSHLSKKSRLSLGFDEPSSSGSGPFFGLVIEWMKG